MEYFDHKILRNISGCHRPSKAHRDGMGRCVHSPKRRYEVGSAGG